MQDRRIAAAPAAQDWRCQWLLLLAATHCRGHPQLASRSAPRPCAAGQSSAPGCLKPSSATAQLQSADHQHPSPLPAKPLGHHQRDAAQAQGTDLEAAVVAEPAVLAVAMPTAQPPVPIPTSSGCSRNEGEVRTGAHRRVLGPHENTFFGPAKSEISVAAARGYTHETEPKREPFTGIKLPLRKQTIRTNIDLAARREHMPCLVAAPCERLLIELWRTVCRGMRRKQCRMWCIADARAGASPPPHFTTPAALAATLRDGGSRSRLRHHGTRR